VYGKFGYQAMPTYEVAISPEDPAAQATHELIERDITGLPVIDEDGRVLGVVRELDLLRAIRNGGDLRQIPVGTLMDRRPLFVGPELEANHDL
jgi:CBS domain-containing protein